MFEDMTYENILEQLLKNVPSDVDKREGSIIFDTLSPAAIELANMYISLDIILNNAFAETAERNYLVLKAKELGLEPFSSTKAILKLDVIYRGKSENVVEGDKFILNNLTYTAIEKISFGSWKVECDTKGTVGNTQLGKCLPMRSIKDLLSANLTEVLIYGEEVEETEEFRKRYFKSINSNAFAGNRSDYIKKVKAINGVGQVRAVRAPKGGGSVKIIITDTENNVASEELIKEVKQVLDPSSFEGLGYGEAPIGHLVVVESVSKCSVNVSIKCESDGVLEKSKVEAIIKSYFDEVNENWEKKNSLKIYSAHIISRLLDIDEVIDVSSVSLNGYLKLESDSEIFILNSLEVVNWNI